MREVFAESMAEVLVMLPPAPEQHGVALSLASANPGIQSWVGAYYMLRQAKGLTLEDIATSVVPATGMAKPRFSVFAAEHNDTKLAVATFQSIQRDEYEKQRDYGILLIRNLIYQKHFDEARIIWNS